MPKTVLISPLDWGLGHATRCVPIINYYIENGCIIIIGGNGSSFLWLKQKYPSLIFENIPGYNVVYSKKVPFVFQMIFSLPRIYFGLKKEQKAIKSLQEKYHFDLIISDNRFGVYLNSVPSYLITHQLNIQFPFFENLIFNIQKKLIQKFKAVLVPDTSTLPNLAGKLSILKKGQKLKIPIYYLGVLSRFYEYIEKESTPTYQYLGIISGPEPYKTELTELLIQEFAKTNNKCAILTYNYSPLNVPKNIDFYLSANDEQFLDVISKSEIVISRPGYSTIMDLVNLKKKVYFIPTPGQTEQIYLAEYLNKNWGINYCLQSKFSKIISPKMSSEIQIIPIDFKLILEKL